MRLLAFALLLSGFGLAAKGQQFPGALGLKVVQSYSDNIFFQPAKTSDYVTEVAPFLNFYVGQKMTFDVALDQESFAPGSNESDINFFNVNYQPRLYLYAKNSYLDVVDEHADVFYAHRFTRLTLGLEQSYEKLSQPTIQNNAQGTLVHRDIFTTTARANYVVSDDLSTYATANQIVSDYQTAGYTSTTEWNADAYFLYQLFPKTTVGFGPRLGYVAVDRAADQEYQDLLVHVGYVASDKLSFVAVAGGELREVRADASPSRLTPLFEVSGTYKPLDSTVVTVSAGRHRIVSNTFVGQDYTATTVGVAVEQRLFDRFYLDATAGYENDQYESVGGENGGPVYGHTREDNFGHVRASLDWREADWITLSAGYSYSRDLSNLEAFSFVANRFNLSATFLY